jgi:hypothetical protein
MNPMSLPKTVEPTGAPRWDFDAPGESKVLLKAGRTGNHRRQHGSVRI